MTFWKKTGFYSAKVFFKILYLFHHHQIQGPPPAGAFKARESAPTSFRKFYERGDFPIALEHDTKGNKIAWKVLMSKSIAQK